MINLHQVYSYLPHPLRVLAASAHGYRLRWWRYSAKTEEWIDQAMEREHWSPNRWENWRQEQLARILHRAATQVPYYRQQWQERRQHGDHAPWDRLENWSVLSKEALRKYPAAFVADDQNIKQMYVDHTGGTTGTPLNIYLSRRTVQQWYAVFEARLRRWNDVSIEERWAIFGGQLVVPYRQQHPPFWVFNAGLNQLYLSSHHITPQNADDYLEALRRFQPTHMIVYPASASVLANLILDRHLVPPELKVIISNAEPLQEYQKDIISRAYRCPVRNSYGMAEIVLGASECKSGNLHFWPETGILEVLDEEDSPVLAEKSGRFIGTSLLNMDTPLIRYDIGDRGVGLTRKECSCGRSLPILAPIDGRSNDLILTSDGRKVFLLNPAFYGLPVREAQIVQEEINRIRVRLVTDPGFTNQHIDTLLSRLKTRIGNMDIDLEFLNMIPREPNGKFRAVINRVTQTPPLH